MDEGQDTNSGIIWGVGLILASLFIIFTLVCAIIWRAVGSLGSATITFIKRGTRYVLRR
ncbi:hypothetical protein CPT_Moabite_290 [Serratia phage Moabite]|uniref:Uncharacterized protein n=3 Tax=Moabitevirus TaxID=2843422 RepID=A0A7T3NBX0_9CAUD|nr:hypothetical protein HWB23_gp220 [Serratia phage vB_SmaM_ 2050HW]YP_009849384.1 hypothetical protein HWC48_gp126 [Serratia phage Moabite]QPX76864.1 hypothetical protein [Serratia phage vB_SmaM_Yaphecito]UCR74811.1 hypothetical protein [Serratia phage BUCT660]UGO54173.1 hypothetical protein HAYMO_191 [Serratia phage vB_SmaM_Haymo]ATA65555.1 hypothetical protein 2050HW_00220 [Serratia phage vB_SmaM_ 2050HW]QDB71320.1 hypothetical protein CPT_Moabite_290 [Serratia phage Moabite]